MVFVVLCDVRRYLELIVRDYCCICGVVEGKRVQVSSTMVTLIVWTRAGSSSVSW